MSDEQGVLLELSEGAEAGSSPAAGSSEAGDEQRGEPRYKPIDRSQVRLVVRDVEALIPAEHAARAIWKLVEQLDLEAYERPIRALEGVAGRAATDPRLLISVWVYGYSRGISSARELERQMAYEPGLRWLTGDEAVGAHTLSDFRSRNEEALKELFVEVLGVLGAAGLVKLERVMQDGTKIRACAGSDSFRRQGHLEEELEAARRQVEELSQVSEEEEEGRRPAARQRAAREYAQRLEAAREAIQQIRETRRRKRKDPEEARASVSDPEARIMKQAGGGTAPSYNAQAVTDADSGVIVAAFVSQASSDAQLLEQGLAQVEQNLGQKPEQMVVDGGYTTRPNIVKMQEQGVDLYGSVGEREAKREAAQRSAGISEAYRAEAFSYDAEANCYRCPQGAVLVQIGAQRDAQTGRVTYNYAAEARVCAACAAKPQCCPKARKLGRSLRRVKESPAVVAFYEKMQSEEARAIYRQRSQVAEFPLACIKSRFRLRQFRLRGRVKVGMEWLWACLTHNILKWVRLCFRAPASATA